MRAYAELFAALADPTRLSMVVLLSRHGELCVCDIQAVLSLSQSGASRHLKVLRLAGLLEDRRVGAWAHYRVAASGARKELVESVVRLAPPEAVRDIDGRFREYQAARAASSCADASAEARG